MNQTYCIVCIECKEYLWIGQGWADEMNNFYNNQESWKALKLFLNKHKFHELRFTEDSLLDWTDAVEVELNKNGTDLVKDLDEDDYTDLSELTTKQFEKLRDYSIESKNCKEN